MALFVKICGVTTPDAIAAAVAAGADAIGFVFADSPRRISVADAAALSKLIPESIIRVAVMRHPTLDDWTAVAAGFAPDWLQTDAADIQRLAISDSCLRLPVYRDDASFDPAVAAAEPRILYEGAVSGSGQCADWSRGAQLARRTELILAGGLNPDNVAEAVAEVQPWGIDVSSGVESSRGIKDIDKVAAFVTAARKAEKTHAN